MKLSFTESGWADYLWLQEHDKELLKRTNLLIKDVLRSPFQGVGKPELLKATNQVIGRTAFPRNIDWCTEFLKTRLSSSPAGFITRPIEDFIYQTRQDDKLKNA